MAEPAVKDEDVLEAERRARAALREDPPTLVPGPASGTFTLEARPAVLDYIRDVGPPVVLKLIAEIRRLRGEEERLIGRLRSVETWSLEGGRRQ